MATVQFQTDDAQLIQLLRKIAVEYAPQDQNRTGQGTGARILIERLKDRPDLLRELLAELDSDGRKELPKAVSEPPASQQAAGRKRK